MEMILSIQNLLSTKLIHWIILPPQSYLLHVKLRLTSALLQMNLFSALRSMALYKMRKVHPGWLILPAVTFLYEMLPVNIPGPFDDYFAFGGSAFYLVFQAILATTRDEMSAVRSSIASPVDFRAFAMLVTLDRSVIAL